MKNSFSFIKVLTIVTVVAITFSAVPGFAQEEAPKYEFFGGFSVMSLDKDKELLDGSVKGWDTSFAFNLNERLAVVADVSGMYNSIENVNDSSIKRHLFLGGVQYTKRYEKLNVFGEVLAGFARASLSVRSNGDGYNGFAMAIGGGVDWKINEKIGWRIAKIDYLPIRWDGATTNHMRFSTGILIPIGK